MDREKIKVLYIGGHSRSGSTLVDRILGSCDGFVSMGELIFIWQRGFVENLPCACGELFEDCPFWNEVMTKAYGGLEIADFESALWLKRAVGRIRYIPLLTSPRKPRSFERNLERYSEHLTRLYSAIQRTTGAGVIVDSSKSAPHLYVLANTPGIDLHVVHLVRDSRAVAHSWLRKKVGYSMDGEPSYMRQQRVIDTAAGWIRSNLLIEPIRLKVGRGKYAKVRYEDMVAKPEETVSSVLGTLGVGADGLPFTDRRTVHLGPNHILSGNPMRFKSGATELKLDDEWKSGMRASDRRAVTALTWPFLWRYGYFAEGR